MNVLDHVQAEVGRVFRCSVKKERSEPGPAYALDLERNQYLASMVIERLRSNVSANSASLAVVDVDLFAPGLNFVFGEAEVSGAAAVISLARLRPSFYGLPVDDQVTRVRAAKEAIHELGHVAGLEHCPQATCVMSFSNDIEMADRKGAEFCPACRKTIRADM